MAGTRIGGIKSAQIVKKRDSEFYAKIGAKGGKKKSPTKGFGSNKTLASLAGAKGGRISRRTA